MQHYLHISGGKDGLSYPAVDDAETEEWPVAITDEETYTRSTLSVGDVSTYIFIRKSLTPEQTFNRIIEHYKAWAVNMPGGRR
jgi:hypothetical protein